MKSTYVCVTGKKFLDHGQEAINEDSDLSLKKETKQTIR